MTSEVIVRACCGPDTEVHVTAKESDINNNTTENVTVLQDGGELSLYVYDGRTVEVKEVEKSGD